MSFEPQAEWEVLTKRVAEALEGHRAKVQIVALSHNLQRLCREHGVAIIFLKDGSTYAVGPKDGVND